MCHTRTRLASTVDDTHYRGASSSRSSAGHERALDQQRAVSRVDAPRRARVGFLAWIPAMSESSVCSRVPLDHEFATFCRQTDHFCVATRRVLASDGLNPSAAVKTCCSLSASARYTAQASTGRDGLTGARLESARRASSEWHRHLLHDLSPG